MVRSLFLVLFIFFVLLLNNSQISECLPIPFLKTEPALLVISYDGFRPDYLNRNVTPHLNQFRKEGTSAEYMLNVFPTKTFVNHFSIATGLYADNHGILSNDLFDRKLGKYLQYGSELYHYSNETIPIWTANELEGKTSGCMMWSGSEFQYKGINCTFTVKFDYNKSWKYRIDTALSWFQDNRTPANLVMLYIDEPDGSAHVYGPESKAVTEVLTKLDDFTGYIQEQLIKTGLDKRVNVIHVSDHGMNTVIPLNFIDLRKFVEKDSCEMYGTSPVTQIVPAKGKEAEVFRKLTKAAKENGHFKVYNKHNIPTRWHANNTVRLGPIIAVADVGYGFQDMWSYAENFQKLYNVSITNETTYGIHGYDNEEPSMHATFMAKGPLINSGKTIKPINVIDLYNLFCLILNIYCEPNDGSSNPDTWYELFKVKPVKITQHRNDYVLPWLITGILLSAVGMVTVFLLKRRRMFRVKNVLLSNCQRSNVALTSFVATDDSCIQQT